MLHGLASHLKKTISALCREVSSNSNAFSLFLATASASLFLRDIIHNIIDSIKSILSSLLLSRGLCSYLHDRF